MPPVQCTPPTLCRRMTDQVEHLKAFGMPAHEARPLCCPNGPDGLHLPLTLPLTLPLPVAMPVPPTLPQPKLSYNLAPTQTLPYPCPPHTLLHPCPEPCSGAGITNIPTCLPPPSVLPTLSLSLTGGIAAEPVPHVPGSGHREAAHHQGLAVATALALAGPSPCRAQPYAQP